MIVVMGATGNTGRVVTERLLEKGERVRVVARSKDKLQALASQGAQILSGDSSDPAFLARAFTGAEAAYTLIPPNVAAPDPSAYQDRFGETIVKALRESGVRDVVFLSSLGAELPSGTGPIAGLHRQEQRLRGLEGVNVLSLRPGYFFENQFGTLGLIQQQGINGGAMRGDIPIVMIATRDIGEAAAHALLARDFKGFVVRELRGPRELTLAEATRILGEKIGKPDLQYVQFPEPAFVEALVQMGLSRGMSELYAEMSRAFNEGKIRSLEGAKPENTTPTRFEDFAEALAQAYRSM